VAVDASLSVVIATYNRAHTLSRAVRSVLDQTYKDFEIVVVDDGSKDRTAEVVASFNDTRIKYIKHDRNRGVSAARNTGINATTSKYVAFQDSDDVWLPEKLDKQMAIFKEAPPSVGVVYTGFLKIAGGSVAYVPGPSLTKKDGRIYDSLICRGNYVTPQAAVVRRECFEKAGLFDENIRCFEDWELWLRISECYEFKCVDQPLVIVYGGTEDSLLGNLDAAAEGLELITKKHWRNIRDKDRRLLASYYISVANNFRSMGQFRRARNYYVKAAAAYPFDVRCVGAALAASLGDRAFDALARIYHTTRRRFARA